MKTKLISAALFAALMLSTPAMTATQNPIVAAITGTCTAKIIGDDLPCNPKVAFDVGNGRSLVQFFFLAGDLSFAVSGGQDRQPNLNNYYLSIDTLRILRGAKRIAEDRHMEGECHFTLSDDGNEFYLVHCDVYDRRKSERYPLHLDNITKTVKEELK